MHPMCLMKAVVLQKLRGSMVKDAILTVNEASDMSMRSALAGGQAS